MGGLGCRGLGCRLGCRFRFGLGSGFTFGGGLGGVAHGVEPVGDFAHGLRWVSRSYTFRLVFGDDVDEGRERCCNVAVFEVSHAFRFVVIAIYCIWFFWFFASTLVAWMGLDR